MTTEVRRAADRFTTDAEGRTTRHSFSFDRHYDPANVGHALLVAHNDDLVQPGHGYDRHPHQDTEIVTWVLEGSLVHEDSDGRSGVVVPGLAQALSAGSGVLHSERNDAAGAQGPARFVQMWVRPDEPGLAPSYAQGDVDLTSGGLVPVASGRRDLDAAVRIHADAALHVARLTGGDVVRLPDAPYLHLFVARGAVELEGAGTLGTGDAARIAGEGGHRVGVAGGTGDAEVLVWEMHAGR